MSAQQEAATHGSDEPATPPLSSPPQTPQREARRPVSVVAHRNAAGSGVTHPVMLLGEPAALQAAIHSVAVAGGDGPAYHPDSDDASQCAAPMTLQALSLGPACSASEITSRRALLYIPKRCDV